MDKRVVLLVEDNVKLNAGNRYILEKAGYEVLTALNLAEAREHLSRRSPDVILLDIVLPDGDGTEFCVEIRDATDAHIIFLTSRREHEEKLRGLEVGGDDYITKPFKTDELLHRVKAAMRRRGMSRAPEQEQTVITRDRLTLDTVSRRAYIDGTDLNLKPIEYGILLFLVRSGEKAADSETLYEKVWGQPMGGDKNALHKAVSDLRKKIEPAGYTVGSVYGKGLYTLERL